MATGLLLVNLGTPDDATPSAVRRYLRQFLSDPRVLDMNRVGRFFLLNLIILPRRPKASAHAYQQIWDPKRGSPLLYHSQDLVASVAERLGGDWKVELGMRYGNPSIEHGLDALVAAKVDRLVVLPLFPQYASSSTGSALEEIMRVASAPWNVPPIDIVPPFWNDLGFLDAEAAIARPAIAALAADHVLFSFHGLPERHVVKSDETGNHCLKAASCCDAVGPSNRHCYRAQSYATARSIAARLGLAPDGWSVSFQSRLGKVPWIKPYTDIVLDELAAKGVKRLAVVCPAFVADCLETLEEIGIRAREQFRAKGGEDLALVPSLNAAPVWADAVAAIARAHDTRPSR
ncbi:MAG: ferrochelatase [Deltaproteobacteria bacterium]|nr:ferrochelatase [Deltaproteobacteria bacterium]